MINEVITSSDIYWITRCDYIQGAFTGFGVVFGLASAAMWLIYLISINDYNGKAPKGFAIRWFTTPIAVLSILCACAMPKTNEMIAIKVIPMIANNQDIQGVGQELINTAKEWLIELKPSNRDRR